MADGVRLADEASLRALREWAWERGRTDVVGRLDTHAAALGFLDRPSMLQLVRLGELLPLRERAEQVEPAVHRLAEGEAGADSFAAVTRQLAPWFAMLCRQLVADLDEMGSS